MEALHAWTSCEHRRQQRRLTAIASALGLLVGIGVGAAWADAPAADQASPAVTTHAPAPPATAETPVVDAAGDTPAGADAEAPTATAVAAPLDPPLWHVEPEDAGSLSLVPLLVKVSFGLGLVVLLAWGTVYLLRRSALGSGLSNAASAVRVLDRNWLGPKKAIYLVDIGGRTLALGVTEEQISVLSAWEAGEIDVAAPAHAGAGAFATQLRALITRTPRAEARA